MGSGTGKAGRSTHTGFTRRHLKQSEQVSRCPCGVLFKDALAVMENGPEGEKGGSKKFGLGEASRSKAERMVAVVAGHRL